MLAADWIIFFAIYSKMFGLIEMRLLCFWDFLGVVWVALPLLCRLVRGGVAGRTLHPDGGWLGGTLHPDGGWLGGRCIRKLGLS